MNRLVKNWFNLYEQVAKLSEKKDYHFDQRMLKEISTTLFINSQNGRLEQEPSYQVPEELKGIDSSNGSNGNGYGNKDNGNHRNKNNGNGSTMLATDNQIEALQKLTKNPKVNKKEKKRIKDILSEPEISKSTASEILSYFYGQREKQNGKWKKIEDGVLDKRYQKQAA